KPLREPEGRLRFLDVEEEARLLAACGQPLRTIILVGIYAGLRIKAEALSLQWADVHLKRNLLTVQAAYAKSGERRSLPLNKTLRGALESLKTSAKSEYVFTRFDGKPLRSIRTAFETACRRAGLSGLTPHVLRHTFASRLAMAGVGPRTIQELGGWKEL